MSNKNRNRNEATEENTPVEASPSNTEVVEAAEGVPVEVTVETAPAPTAKFKLLSVDELSALTPEALAAYKIAFDQHEADRKARNNSNYRKYKAKLEQDPVAAAKYKEMKKKAAAKHQAKQKAIQADLLAAKKRLEELTSGKS